MAKKQETLSAKEARFVDAFLGSCNGNATEACLAAGYSRNRKSAAEIGSRLLRKVKIAQAVKARTTQERKSSILTAERRDELLSIIAEGKAPALVRISAIKELNKCTGRHSMRHLHEGKLTLEQALAASRRQQ